MARSIEMCIDDQLISAYLDGELKEPYLTEVKEHLSYCQACRDRLKDFKTLDGKIKEALALREEERDRHKAKIAEMLEKKYFEGGRKSIFRRKVELSLSSLVTAAAALVFVFVGGFAFFGEDGGQTGEILPSYPLRAEVESASFVSDEKVTLDDFSLEEILSYLDQKGYVVDVTLKGIRPINE